MKKATMKLEAILAQNLSDLMEKTVGLDTIDKVAVRSGVGRGTVDRVRKAEVSTKIETVELLAAAFGVSPIALLSEQGEAEAAEPASPARAPYSMQWLDGREESLLTSYRSTDDEGRRTLDNIAAIVPKVSFAVLDKAE